MREELVRRAAYAYYEAHGRTDGHDLDDWLKAEALVDIRSSRNRTTASSV